MQGSVEFDSETAPTQVRNRPNYQSGTVDTRRTSRYPLHPCGCNCNNTWGLPFPSCSTLQVQHGTVEDLYLHKRKSLGHDPLRQDADPEALWAKVGGVGKRGAVAVASIVVPHAPSSWRSLRRQCQCLRDAQ